MTNQTCRFCAAPLIANGCCTHHARAGSIADAETALGTAREAVAEAREAVIDAARGAAERWGPTPWVPYDESDSCDITNAVRKLEEAERAEAEALARAEALR
jgi:hypothetical protein